MKKPEIDWIIHCCRNGVVCGECGDVENGFVENGITNYPFPILPFLLKKSHRTLAFSYSVILERSARALRE